MLRAWALALALALLGVAAHAGTLGVIPQPLSVSGTPEQRQVRIASGDAIAVPAHDAPTVWAARYLQDLVRRTPGVALRVAPGDRAAKIIFTRTKDATLGPEAYRLDVAKGRVRITARTDVGLFYGAMTLWQLMTADQKRGVVALSPVEIADAPRFPWRGLLLDSARHYQSPAFVEQLIDRMARLKLNVLQWHLTDDQAWRVEIKRYPRLTSVGAWRAAVDPRTGKPVRDGGFYSQPEIRRIVAYAAQRHVVIVPEIDTPGHSLAAILAYPKLGAAPGDPKTEGDWGIFPSILDPSPETVTFMEGVLTEVMQLFPGPWINVGGDEAVKDEWRASPKIQGEMKTLGLANDEALQGWWTAQLGTFLKAHGRRLIGWDDILKGGAQLPADAAVVSWHLDGAAEALKQGRDAVIATDPTLYFDHRQSGMSVEPPGRGKVVSIADVYALEPAPASMPADQRAHIIGVQANLWTEHMPSERDVALMAFPRAAALAELAWSAPQRKDWADFQARLPGEVARDKALGLAVDDEEALAKQEAALKAAHPGRLTSQQLTPCVDRLGLNLAAPLAGQGGPYLVDIMNPCWIYPQAELGAARTLSVAVTRLPFNFQIGADVQKIPLAPPQTPDGELVVHDGCAGPALASVPLAEAAKRGGVTVLRARLPALSGRHDLCLSFTRTKVDPMWVVGWAEAAP